MNTWISQVSRYHVPCQFGHEAHVTRVAGVDLAGAHAADFASFPAARRCQFDLEVYDVNQYANTAGGWCQGNAAVARGILEQGIWEAYETRLALEIFATHSPGLVLDFGANIGWYSILAAMHGHRVYAFEMEPETASLCERNLARNGLSEAVMVMCGFIDALTPQLPITGEVLLLKSDVEGSEANVLQCCADLIADKRVRYMLLEISPCFNDSYGHTLEWLMGFGYAVYCVPSKRHVTRLRKAFSEDPLGAIREFKVEDPHDFVAGIHQENVLVVRP